MTFFVLFPASAQAALEEWDIFGTTAPLSLETKLGAVSCFSSSACVAVGHYQKWDVFPKNKRFPLAEKWDGEEVSGEAWEYELPPTVAESEAMLAGVSCTSSSTCMAVGTYKSAGGFRVLAERRTESGWESQTPPNPEGVLEAKLEAVSCTSSSECTGVGYYKNGSNEIVTLAERWDGEKWTIQTTPNPEKGEETILTGVSCASSTECIAVGRYKSEGVEKPLAERWDGKEWKVQELPSPEGALEGRLEEISCPTKEFCFAVGSYKNGSGEKLTLVDRWKGGSWTVQSTPNPEGAEEASLSGISCSIAGGCTATGSYKDEASSTTKTLAERWGGSWKVQYPENPEEADSVLAAASCPSAVFCMTAGFYRGKSHGSIYRPLTERYVHMKMPVNTAKPSISPSTPETGKAATATTGTWTEEPSSYTYQWKRCNGSGLECVNIPGATTSTYYPLAADVEKTLVVEVTAYNEAGNASAASAATGKVKKAGVIIEYAAAAESAPKGIAPGPDENLWFTNSGLNKIGKITTAGSITEYSAGSGSGSQPIGITKGPDGNLWFSFDNAESRVAKITTAGTATKYELSKTMKNGREIAKGPDGNLWFTATEGRVGKITTSGTFTSYEVSGEPTGIAEGPDGNVWLTKRSANKISKMTTGGTVTDYSLPSAQSPYGIVTGPDEKLWFGASGKIGKISTAGTITEYSLPVAGEVKGITEGPDGLLWFAHYGADKIGKITTGGTITEYSLPPGSQPWDVAAGSDGNVWFTLYGSSRIGMIEP